jgi:hypothetical protein
MTLALKGWFFFTVLLVCLLLGTSFAHTLEMAAKLDYDSQRWMAAQHTLYRAFATIGGPIEFGAILCAIVFAVLLRDHRPALLLLASIAAICLAFAFFGIWIHVTNAVNAEVARWTPNAVPPDWAAWRNRWEYSHLVRFALHLVAFAALTCVLLTLAPRAATPFIRDEVRGGEAASARPVPR